MSQPPSKRQRLSPKAQSSPPNDAASSTREALIASLLSERNDGPRKRALVQDLSDPGPSTRPTFDMPDLSGSSSLLARVQSFLPQMQQANSSLSTADGSAFELVEDRDDEDAEENDDIRYAEVDESPIEEDEEPDPQIIIDLALGVLEEQDPESSSSESDGDGETSSSEEDDSEQEQTSHTEVAEKEKETGSIQASGQGSLVDVSKSDHTTRDATPKKTESRNLIQELD